MKTFMKNYFGSSYKEMVSFFTREEEISLDEMEEIKKIMADQIKKKK